MRYLLFFFFLFLHSYFVFAEAPPPIPSCPNKSYMQCQTPYPANVASQVQSNANSCLINQAQHSPYFHVEPSSCSSGFSHFCNTNCVCPEGFVLNVVSQGGNWSSSCIPEPQEPVPPENCPSGYPKFNGQCPVCPTGFNADGSCLGSSCAAGETTQGFINGQAICASSCSDPNQSWGFVNGVEGCYGSPTCPNGGSYGSVNGVSGCYGAETSGGSNTSSGSGTSAGSNTSSGSGTSAGSNTSSGSDGSGGDTGPGGSGGSGGSGGGNDSIGAPYPDQISCPIGFEKSGDKCVSIGRGDCVVGYHQLVVSIDPYLFICVQDDPPPSSSSASSQPQSSQASSQSSSAQSSNQNSSSQNSAVGDGGSNTSSGSGTGGGTGDGSGGSIDPINQGNYALDISQRLQQSRDEYTSRLTQIKNEFNNKVSVNLGSGSGSLPTKEVTLFGQSVELGLVARADFFDAIRWLFLAVATVLALYIILSK